MPDLLIEIGCEERPARACREAERQLPELLSSSLSEAGLESRAHRIHVGPRRLVAIRSGPPPRDAVASQQRGPRADAPEAARAGFARKHGMAAEELEQREGFVWAVSDGRAAPAAKLVPEAVHRVVAGLQFAKTMRWPGGRFSRPIRWLVVKLDDEVVEMELAGLASGGESRGHRSLGAVRVGSAASYLDDLRGVHVLADAAERRELIVEGLNAAGEWIDPMGKLDEVVHLVEWPVVLEGRFDERYLELPERVPITAMQSHQRYFPIVREGRLDARFTFVANGGDAAVVAAGNEEVLVGRLEDAVFAHDQDRARGIAAMLAELPRVSFLEGAGALADKAEGGREISRQLGDRVEVEPPLREAVARAAELCKADLVSSLVAEFSDLQGYAGSLYARDAGEPSQVCDAIAEHHLPIEAGGTLPADEGAALLSVSDKADTVAVAFALGAQPTGSRDPYGLRRAAAGIVAIALDRSYELGLVDLMAESVHMLVAQGHELKRKPLEAVPDAVEFVLDRVEPVMLEEGVTVEEIRAARGSGVTGPLPLAALSRALRDARGSERLAAVHDAYGRCVRITARAADEAASELRTSLFEMDEERALCAALGGADIEIADAAAQRDYGSALNAARGLVDPINDFFDKVMVMAEDPAVRGNRLKLLLDV